MIKALSSTVLLIAVLMLTGCGGGGETSSAGGSDIAHDRTTPEGAILTLEDAYRAKDLDAALACRDFELEAKFMLEKVGDGAFSKDEEMLKQTAEVLKLGYTAEIGNSFPDFWGVKSVFSNKQPYKGKTDVVQFTETCTSAGGSSVNTMVVAKTDDGWKVLTIPED